MEIIGKFVKTLPEQRGTSQRGDWVRGGFVIETEEQYPKQLAFSLWGEDKVAIVRTMTIGTQLKVFFSPESREFNDKWFTDLRCFRIDVFGSINKTQQVAQPQQSNTNPINDNSLGSFESVPDEDEESLPF